MKTEIVSNRKVIRPDRPENVKKTQAVLKVASRDEAAHTDTSKMSIEQNKSSFEKRKSSFEKRQSSFRLHTRSNSRDGNGQCSEFFLNSS